MRNHTVREGVTASPPQSLPSSILSPPPRPLQGFQLWASRAGSPEHVLNPPISPHPSIAALDMGGFSEPRTLVRSLICSRLSNGGPPPLTSALRIKPRTLAKAQGPLRPSLSCSFPPQGPPPSSLEAWLILCLQGPSLRPHIKWPPGLSPSSTLLHSCHLLASEMGIHLLAWSEP